VAGGFDFIFLPIGNHELRSALEVVVPNLRPDQYLVLSGNLWDGFDYLENNIPGRYVLAFPHFGGAITEGTLSGWLTRNLSLGYISAENSKQLEQLKAFFESNGFKPKIRPDLKEWMLTHFAWNTGIMTEAYVQGGFRNMLRRFRNLKRAYYITREAMQVVKLLGVDYLRFEEGRMSEKPVWLNAIKVALLFKMSRIARIFDAAGNIPEWKSYGRSVLITSREKNLYLPYLEYYSELLV
jgi:ketopantoate reductase